MGLSFAIPVDVMKNIVEQLKTSGKVSRGWLGVLIQDVTRELAESFGMEKPRGALVAKVLPNSPAEAASFQVGDIIVSFNGKEVDHSSDLPPMVGMTPVGTAATAQVIRQGKAMDLTVTIAELPSEDELELASTEGGGKKSMATSNLLGIAVADLDDKQREDLNLSEGGVIVQRVNEGPAQTAGVRKDDVIMMINNIKIKDAAHFKELVGQLERGQMVPILIHRRDAPLFLALKIPKAE
jgi:serine protease Do